MIRTFVAVLFIFISINSRAQDAIDCEKILDTQPYFVKNKTDDKDSLLKRDIEILKHCGNFDSIDSAFFKGSILGALMLDQVRLGKPATYRTVVNMLRDFRKTSAYKDFADGMSIYRKLKEKRYSLSTWDSDKEFFVRLGFTVHDLADFKLFLEASENSQLTYMAALSKYMAEIESLDK